MKKVTFILTVYNHSKYLVNAFESIEYQAEYIDELIITNDKSSDNSSFIIEEFIGRSAIKKIHYIDNKINKGLNHCLNKAFNIASGDIIILQSGDDLSSPDRIRNTLEEFSGSEKLFLISSYQIISEEGKSLRKVIRKGNFTDVRKIVKRGAALPIYGFAFKKQLLTLMPQLDESISNEDDMIGFYAVLHGGIVICKKILYDYRIHQNSMSNWAISSDGDLVLKNFYIQLRNREQNYLSWRKELMRTSVDYDDILNIIDKKLDILEYYKNIKNKKFINRLLFMVKMINVISLRDVIIIIGGELGIKKIPLIKKYILFFKK